VIKDRRRDAADEIDIAPALSETLGKQPAKSGRTLSRVIPDRDLLCIVPAKKRRDRSGQQLDRLVGQLFANDAPYIVFPENMFVHKPLMLFI
jgi:hypothetical protein